MLETTPWAPAVPQVQVPFLDLKAQYAALEPQIRQAVLETIASGTYVLGPKVAAFENAFAEYHGARHCIGVNSGTSALHLALLAAGVGPGDEVITVPMTFVATSWAISYLGARPVFVDVDPVTYTMDVSRVERAISQWTRALLPVHLYGQPADLGPLREISQRHGIPLIEDAAQAHGAAYQGKSVGTWGQSACFSFYPGKNLGAYGEGGAILTNDDAVMTRIRRLRDHAQAERYHHDEIGFNYRMDAIQGAILGVKLKHLEKWTQARRRLAQRYRRLLRHLPLTLPSEAEDRRHVWHLFVVQTPLRNGVQEALQARGIQTGLHYPRPVHLQKAYRDLGYQAGAFPVTERIARECLTLPLYPEMTDEQQDAVCAALSDVLQEEQWS
jgi:dTDP-4-amino-4,6-dideoxygalactose transaminase